MTAATDAAPVGGRRERTKQANRAAILRAARDVFAEEGYEASSIRDVVRRTDLAAGTFYNYFPDKESVLRALLAERAEELRARLRKVRARASDFESLVGDAYRVYFAFLAEDPALVELLRRNAGTVRALAGEPELIGGVEDLLGDLRTAVEAGEVAPFDLEYMAAAMAGAGLEIAVRMSARAPTDVEGAARFATALFLGGTSRLVGRGGPGASKPRHRRGAPAR